MKNKKKLIDYTIILIFAIAISIPMLTQNFNIYVDDGIQHIARLMGTMQSIEEGQVIPVIMSNFCNGFGYSWNLFYSPITAYIPLIFSIFTNSFELMLKLFIVLVGFLSGIAMYEFVNKISHYRWAGLLSAIIYMCAPYRLTDMYMRMAVSELTSFMFLPIVFHGMYNLFNICSEKETTIQWKKRRKNKDIKEEKIDRKNKNNDIKVVESDTQANATNIDNDTIKLKEKSNKEANTQNKNTNGFDDENKRNKRKYLKNSLLLTLGASGLILTHSVIAMYTAIICFIFLLVNIKKLKNIQVLKALAVNMLLILLITSFYTVPLLEHKLATDYEVFKPGRMERTDALIYYKVDLLDLIYTGNNTMSYEMGLVSIVGLVLTILAHKKVDKNIRKFYWFSLVTGILCVIMSLRIFPFEKMPSILKMLQFTFRLLEFSSFFFAVISGINYSLVIKDFKLRDVLVLGIISYLLIVPLFFKFNYDKQWTEEKLWPAVGVNENTGRVHAGCASFEYLPSKAFEHLDYIKTRENRVYVLAEDGTYKLPISSQNALQDSLQGSLQDSSEDSIQNSSKNIILENNKAIIIENEKKNGTKLSFSVRKIDDEEVASLNNLNTLNNLKVSNGSNNSNNSSNIVETEKNENQNKKKESELQDTQNGITLELPYIYYLGYTVKIDTNGKIQKLETFESENGFVAIRLPNSVFSTDGEVDVTVEYTGTALMKITYIVSILSSLGTGLGAKIESKKYVDKK